jgi:hypothetical protein
MSSSYYGDKHRGNYTVHVVLKIIKVQCAIITETYFFSNKILKCRFNLYGSPLLEN